MILESFWDPFCTVFHVFFSLKIDGFFNVIWDAFWMDFGSPDPRKWSSRLSETLIFIKSPFSPWNRFWMENGGESGAKMMPKCL